LTPPPESSSDTAAPAADGVVQLPLDDVQRAAVDALQADGIAVVPFVDLLGEELWNAARADIDPFIRETEEATRDAGDRPAGKEEVIARRFYDKAGDKEKPSFSIDSPWLRIAASDAMLGIVNSYRQRQTRLYYLDNWFTVPYPGAGDRVASQRWHRDPEDEHIVKSFVYFSDVDEEAGPFEYVRGSTAGGRYGDLWPWSEGHRYPPTDELEAAVPPEDRFLVTAPAGTIIIADTGGFHRGGFARTKPRILSIATYLRSDRKEGKRRFTVDYAGREDEVGPQARAALS
jgi:Phytanoyl-CoA dioxygenase (PhyH)